MPSTASTTRCRRLARPSRRPASALRRAGRASSRLLLLRERADKPFQRGVQTLTRRVATQRRLKLRVAPRCRPGPLQCARALPLQSQTFHLSQVAPQILAQLARCRLHAGAPRAARAQSNSERGRIRRPRFHDCTRYRQVAAIVSAELVPACAGAESGRRARGYGLSGVVHWCEAQLRSTASSTAWLRKPSRKSGEKLVPVATACRKSRIILTKVCSYPMMCATGQ